jgi:hypothetical protein
LLALTVGDDPVVRLDDLLPLAERVLYISGSVGRDMWSKLAPAGVSPNA